jgi:hypothetical protein
MRELVETYHDPAEVNRRAVAEQKLGAVGIA